MKSINDDKNETTLWEFFLHKINDKSFDEFKRSVMSVQGMNKKELETTINKSKNILNNFIPEGGE